MRFLPFTVVTYLFLASIPAGAAEIDVSGLKFRADIQPLLAKYCFRCHGQQEPEAGVTLSRFGTTQEMLEERNLWLRVLEQLESREMPTEEPLPTDEERDRLIAWINQAVSDIDWTKIKNPGHVTLPRLNKEEYNNTMRDLLGVDLRPGDFFSADGQGRSGFNTDRESLFLTPALMEKYFEAAQQSIDAIVALEKDPVQVHLESEDMFMTETKETPQRLSDDFFGYVLNRGQMSLYDSIKFSDPGIYEFRIRARTIGEPTSARLQINNAQRGKVHVPSTAPDIYSVKTVVRAGNHQVQWNIVHPRQHEGLLPNSVAIDWIEVRGPLRPAGLHKKPPLLMVHPGDGVTGDEAARRILQQFLPRAFRRPIDVEELDCYLVLFKQADAAGEGFLGAVKVALAGVLVSPHFLYRPELATAKNNGEAYALDQYHLASRLSYFLWQSMPDDELFELARDGRLRDTDLLRQQIKRMLNDPKSRSSWESFLGQWLGFAPLGKSVVPDSQVFPDFSSELTQAMKNETVLFFESLLKENRSLLELLDSNETWLNARLARHYGLPGVDGDDMVRVKLDDQRRGGLLGMASVQTATSTPMRTSPVVRGAWVLQTLLGETLPEPPADAGALPGDAGQKEGLTLREELIEHRRNESCSGCHRKIDPIGFGLENFDAIGRFRTEENGKPIDSRGELPDGVTFHGPVELKQYLLTRRKDDFVRNVTSKMLAYALGRPLRFYDEPVIDKITRALESNGYKARTLIEEVVLSYPFEYQK